jgi:hypothetical protein
VTSGQETREEFPGLSLRAADRRALKARTKGRQRISARLWRRIRILELLDRGWNLKTTAAAVGTYRREVRRVGWRYLDRGLGAALTDEPRPKPLKKLDTKQEARVVAMVCGPPPEGRSRWTVELVASETRKRGVVATIGKETIRRVLTSHGLKPWREKNVVRPKTGR